mmetsp:Transcript_69820/g.158397  ORF Transcript_69820/g.158397 Transcript_69820/m.158397 type:complete len:253 (-) Transcript_69820:524-1282(-)
MSVAGKIGTVAGHAGEHRCRSATSFQWAEDPTSSGTSRMNQSSPLPSPFGEPSWGARSFATVAASSGLAPTGTFVTEFSPGSSSPNHQSPRPSSSGSGAAETSDSASSSRTCSTGTAGVAGIRASFAPSASASRRLHSSWVLRIESSRARARASSSSCLAAARSCLAVSNDTCRTSSSALVSTEGTAAALPRLLVSSDCARARFSSSSSCSLRRCVSSAAKASDASFAAISSSSKLVNLSPDSAGRIAVEAR